MMDNEAVKRYIAARAARELKNRDVVNLGIGLPTLVPYYLPEGLKVVLHSENGIINTGRIPESGESDPLYIVNAGGAPAAVAPGGSFIDSSVSFGLIRGGHVDCTILGALEVDQEGNLSNWIIPGKRVPGMGGAMDLVAAAKKVIIAMEHTARGVRKIVKKCSLPLTAVKCVDMIITEMAVIKVTPEGLALYEYNPEFSIEEIQEATEAELIITDGLKPIPV